MGNIKNCLPNRLRLLFRIFESRINKEKNELSAYFCEFNAKADYFDIPIFIINYNRVSFVRSMVERLKKDGYKNINIIDNNSNYPPLLDYYKTVDCRVFRIEENKGHKVFWIDDRFKEYRNSFYVVTDPDVMPINECPNDYIEHFIKIMRKYPFVKKVGFSLKIDDIPVGACFSNEVQSFEKKYYKCFLKKDNIYYANIDTTFAVYAPDSISKDATFYRAFRTGYPYQARHLPWYKKQGDITDEDKYYSEHKTNGWWDFVKGNVTPD